MMAEFITLLTLCIIVLLIDFFPSKSQWKKETTILYISIMAFGIALMLVSILMPNVMKLSTMINELYSIF